MAHNLEFTRSGQARMAYRKANGVPWHGLGQAIPDNATMDEVLKLAHMDQEIRKRRVFFSYFNGMDSAGNPAVDGFQELADKFIVVRDDNKVLSGQMLVSDRYQPVQYRDLIGFFREWAEAGEMEIDTIGSLKGGSWVWAMAKLKDAAMQKYQLPGGDQIKPNVLIATSYDGTLNTIAKAIFTRVVCWNTITAALGEKGEEFRIRHTTKVAPAVAQEAMRALGLCREEFQRFAETCERLTRVSIDPRGQETLQYVAALTDPELLFRAAEKTERDSEVRSGKMDLKALLESVVAETVSTPRKIRADELNRAGKAILQAIVDSPGAGMQSAKGTVWGLLNGATYYADHIAGRTAQDGSRDAALRSAWFGPNAGMKQQAMEYAAGLADGKTVLQQVVDAARS